MTHKTVWIAAFAAPLAWFCDLVVSYAATPPAYRHGLATMSYAASLSSAVIIGLSAIVLGLYLRRAPVWAKSSTPRWSTAPRC
jgi:ABC-type Fe3+ transport system permease subunit